MARHIGLATLLICSGFYIRSIQADPNLAKLAENIRAIEPNVITDNSQETHERLRRMIGNDVSIRLRAVNVRDVADWKQGKSRADWEKRTQRRIEALRKSLGTYPEPPTDLKVRVTRSDKRDGYVVDNIVFESRPGLLVTAHLYRPLQPGKSMPGIVISHSHHRPKEQGELQDMGASWARRGCVVIVPDHIGHGERRQHPYQSAADYNGSFRVSRQDYYFRYNIGMQLHIVGDSLMGWMVWDLRRCVDLVLSRPGVDKNRIIMLGAVAGGGDPCAVAAALDSRIAAAVPFNFGGPQPGERDRLDANSENTISYSGSGGWESTRNLRLSARDGFLPYIIVGSLAPRKLIYAHEFTWDRKHDPLWTRFQKIWGFYGERDNLTYTHGFGRVTQSSTEASHCTNIGPIHRQLIHKSLQQWFGIEPPGDGTQDRRETQQTLCLSGPQAADLHLTPVHELAKQLAVERIAAMRQRLREKTASEQRTLLRASWNHILGNSEPYDAKATWIRSEPLRGARVDRLVIRGERDIGLPLLLLSPQSKTKTKRPVVLMFAQSGKSGLLKRRSDIIAVLLEAGVTVCLPDLRGTGETSPADYRGRRSRATGLSSSELMLGQTMVGSRLRDLRTVIAFLRKQIDATCIAVWGDSLAPINRINESVEFPLGIDTEPKQSEPLGPLLALLAGLYEDDIAAVVAARGGLSSLLTTLESEFCHFPHDTVIPGAAAAGDFADIAATIAPRPLLVAGLVNGVNRRIGQQKAEKRYSQTRTAYQRTGATARLTIWQDAKPGPRMTQWLLQQLIQ